MALSVTVAARSSRSATSMKALNTSAFIRTWGLLGRVRPPGGISRRCVVEARGRPLTSGLVRSGSRSRMTRACWRSMPARAGAAGGRAGIARPRLVGVRPEHIGSEEAVDENRLSPQTGPGASLRAVLVWSPISGKRDEWACWPERNRIAQAHHARMHCNEGFPGWFALECFRAGLWSGFAVAGSGRFIRPKPCCHRESGQLGGRGRSNIRIVRRVESVHVDAVLDALRKTVRVEVELSF
jgi:hypothetical protein